jgi:DNA damage-binding protein 1
MPTADNAAYDNVCVNGTQPQKIPDSGKPTADLDDIDVATGLEAGTLQDVFKDESKDDVTPSTEADSNDGIFQDIKSPARQDKVRKSYSSGDVGSLVKYHEVIDLDKIPEHGEASAGMGGDYIKAFVFGGLDGIVSTFALVAGLGGAHANLVTLIAVGIAKVLADAFSMGFSEFTSAVAELENALSIKAREEWETENFLDGEVKEMAALYMEKGVSKTDALTMLSVMSQYKELFVEHMMVMEHGMMPPEDSDKWAPLKQGIVCFSAFVLFGMVPLIGFIVLYIADPSGAKDTSNIGRVLGIAYGLTCFTLFSMGVTKAKLTGNTKWLRSGLMMVMNGTIAGGVAFGIGEILTESF